MLHSKMSYFPSTYMVDRILRITLSAPHPCVVICPLSMDEISKYHITPLIMLLSIIESHDPFTSRVFSGWYQKSEVQNMRGIQFVPGLEDGETYAKQHWQPLGVERNPISSQQGNKDLNLETTRN